MSEDTLTLTCPICKREVTHVMLWQTDAVTERKTGKRYYLRVYWPSLAHRDATGHDSQVSLRVYLED